MVVHPDEQFRRVLIGVLKASCKEALSERGWYDLPVKEAASYGEINSANKCVRLILGHFKMSTSGSEELVWLRKLRIKGFLSPVIAMIFSSRNAHRVFSAKAHALITYPFSIHDLCKKIKHIKSLNPGDMGYIRERFGDEKYRETLRGSILHAVGHKDWKRIKAALDEFEKCFGGNDSFRKLLEKREIDVSVWEARLKDKEASKNV